MDKPKDVGNLVTYIRIGDAIHIGEDIVLELVTPSSARLYIRAPKKTKIEKRPRDKERP